MKRKRAIVDILKVKKNKDGTADVDISYGQPFVKLFKEENPGKKATKEAIGEWFVKILEQSLDGVS